MPTKKDMTSESLLSIARLLIAQLGPIYIRKSEIPTKSIRKAEVVLGKMPEEFIQLNVIYWRLQNELDVIDEKLAVVLEPMGQAEANAHLARHKPKIYSKTALLDVIFAVNTSIISLYFIDKHAHLDLTEWRFEFRKGWIGVLVKDEEKKEAVTASLNSFNQSRPRGELLH